MGILRKIKQKVNMSYYRGFHGNHGNRGGGGLNNFGGGGPPGGNRFGILPVTRPRFNQGGGYNQGGGGFGGHHHNNNKWNNNYRGPRPRYEHHEDLVHIT